MAVKILAVYVGVGFAVMEVRNLLNHHTSKNFAYQLHRYCTSESGVGPSTTIGLFQLQTDNATPQQIT